MRKLRVQIRTWNRSRMLELCVKRIAQEIKKFNLPIIIFIIDNYSSDETPKVLKKLCKEFEFIISYRTPKWYRSGEIIPIPSEIASRVESEFIWEFGDDDLLLENTLPIVWKVLNSKEAEDCAIVHIGRSNFSPHSHKVYKGTVIEFANLMGFNQFIGWATSIIWGRKAHDIFTKIDTEEMDKICPQYKKVYKGTAYAHVLLILHFFAYDPAIVIDYPIAEPIKPFGEEEAKRWKREDIGWKTFLTIKGFKTLYKEGILKEKLSPNFFKFVKYPLWTRLLSEMIASRMGALKLLGEIVGKYITTPRPEEGWEIIFDIADIINDPAIAKYIKVNVTLAKALCDEFKYLKKEFDSLPEKEKRKESPFKSHYIKIVSALLAACSEGVKPIFEKGWAGEGCKNVLKI